MNKIRVQMDPTDVGKIVEIELTRDACEGVYALCHVLGRDKDTNLADVLPSIQAGMAEVLRQLPKDFDGIAEVPFTAETATTVLSLCCFVAASKPSGAHSTWMVPLKDRIGRALKASQIRCQIVVGDVAVFISP